MNWKNIIKEEKKIPITICLNSSVEKKLRKIKKKEGISCSAIVNFALKNLFKTKKGGKEK